MIKRRLAIVSVLIALIYPTFGQVADSTLRSNTFYQEYPDATHFRLYYSQKFTGFVIDHDELPKPMRYRPNTTRNLGIGGTYKWATLNLAFGFGFLNPDQRRGRTRYLDLQSRNYLKKWNIDLFGQFYRGYYLRNLPDTQTEVYNRPDIRVQEIGTSIQYVFNHDEFSFRAAFLNTEDQLQSAGTWLVGVNLFYGLVEGDSTLTPYFYPDNLRIRKIGFVKFGPLAGYAYTHLFGKNFYATAVGTAHFNTGNFWREGSTDDRANFLTIDLGFKSAVGYQNHRFKAAMMYLLQDVRMSDKKGQKLNTGNFRIILTYRFSGSPEQLLPD